MGFQEFPSFRGLVFARASHGNLQNYLDTSNRTLCLAIREKWCRQVTEATEYIHSKGVIHSDLRPENCLVHKTNTSLDILLCDFGGSMCAEKGIDGKGLPDIPFWDFSWESTVGTDIFSLGSIFYTIRTGHWPYK
jgi:tRNA A-37 threonylcarbamoyl transferase component Bud32